MIDETDAAELTVLRSSLVKYAPDDAVSPRTKLVLYFGVRIAASGENGHVLGCFVGVATDLPSNIQTDRFQISCMCM